MIERARSPTGRFAGGSPSKTCDDGGNASGAEDEGPYPGLSRDLRRPLQHLNLGASTKMSLLKMLVVKCDESQSTYTRIRNGIGMRDYIEVERLLYVLEE